MRLRDAKDMWDIMKILKMKAEKQWIYLLEVEQVHNILLVTYGKPLPERNKEKKWHTLIKTIKVKEDNELPMVYKRVKLNLCKFIEPYKSKKSYYDKMRAEAQNIDIDKGEK